jgi:hypothetical protein
VRDHRPRPAACPDTVADDLGTEAQRPLRPPRWRGLLAYGEQRLIRDAGGRQVDDCAQVQCEAGAAWVVTPGRSDQEDVGTACELRHDALQDGALAKGELPRLERRLDASDARRGGEDLARLLDHGSRPPDFRVPARPKHHGARAQAQRAVRRGPRLDHSSSFAAELHFTIAHSAFAIRRLGSSSLSVSASLARSSLSYQTM